MLRRRRPLVRAAALGGTAYAVGRHQGKGAQQEQDYAPEPVQAQAPPAPAPAAQPDRIATLTQLKELLDSGVLTQEEFDREKQKVLQGP